VIYKYNDADGTLWEFRTRQGWLQIRSRETGGVWVIWQEVNVRFPEIVEIGFEWKRWWCDAKGN